MPLIIALGLLVLYLTGGRPQFKGFNYYAEKLLYHPIYFIFSEFPSALVY